MKKIIGLLGVLGIAMLLLSACGDKAKKDNYQDQNFINSLEKGLEAHWKFAYTIDDSTDQSKSSFETGVKKELAEISKYKSAQFKDSKLQELAISYINILNDQEKTLDNFSSNSFYNDWTTVFDKRTSILLNINNIKPLEFSSKKYQSEFKDLKNNGKNVQNKNMQKKTIDKFISSIAFKAATDNDPESDYKSYNTIIENTTSLNFKDFSLNVKLIDKDGVTVDTQYVSTQDFQKGQKVKLEFETDKPFVKTDLVQSNVTIDEVADN